MGNQIDNHDFVKEQYKNDDNLNARINLHSFNINKIDWNTWFFEKMNIPENSSILELGCGNGLLWKKNEQAIKETLNITLSDFSEGMLQSAKQNLKNEKIKYQVIDIQDIPYENESFDIIIARHMLYHVPDIDKALSEVKRVLKRGGKFYVSTNGKEHMQELERLVKDYDKNIEYDLQKFPNKFGIENGEKFLKKYFSKVLLEEFNGQIVVDKLEPVVSYIMSSTNFRRKMLDEHKLDNFYKYIETEINKVGAFRINTKAGMFIASSP
ncbi:class I SAM-dependent methyltransferase [Clostridium omnivorum]|uniref:Methyltransferase type 11 domain-containing protein n=1 Tax=Clostridium omnivorum TaxID=1604902 RepID=A0ABQ5N932_9CLOT|nr:class I SAM-dependent methyltransferase [Clostridium sp. E14]GLC31773.1 hypothetical protein bsdE14_31830 [Clostridium sp. E14]